MLDPVRREAIAERASENSGIESLRIEEMYGRVRDREVKTLMDIYTWRWM